MTEDARGRVRKHIVTGDNRLKQGDGALLGRARESFERALSLAEAEGIADERLRHLIQLRLDEVDRLSAG
jgi:hypothetical protein